MLKKVLLVVVMPTKVMRRELLLTSKTDRHLNQFEENVVAWGPC